MEHTVTNAIVFAGIIFVWGVALMAAVRSRG